MFSEFTSDSVRAHIDQQITPGVLAKAHCSTVGDQTALTLGWTSVELTTALNLLATITESTDGDERAVAVKRAAEMLADYRAPLT